MEGLTIRKKVTPRAKSTATSAGDIAIGFLIFAVLLAAIPFLLVGLLIGILRDKFTPPKLVKPLVSRPVVMHQVPNTFFPLHYQYIMGDEVSEGAEYYFGDDEPLLLYKADSSTDFFEGYFSSFKIECSQGLFVQRVNFNATLTEVESMPLCFFNYCTLESEEFLDLKGYDLSTRGQLNIFTIIATSQEDNIDSFELEINITSAI